MKEQQCPICNQLLEVVHNDLDNFYFCRTCWSIINTKLRWKVKLPYEKPKNS